MSAKTKTRRFSGRIVRQVQLDAGRSLIRSHFCPDRSEVLHLRCVEDRPESEDRFGSQLWYFEGMGVDAHDRRQPIYGAIEYSLQYGLHELMDDGVFDSEAQRARVRQQFYGYEMPSPMGHPAHRFLLVGVLAMGLAYAAFMAIQSVGL